MKFKRNLILLITAVFFSFSASADRKSVKIMELVQDGSSKQIEKYIRKYPQLAKKTYGEKGDSLIMLAIENGRDADIIKILLKAGVSLRVQNTDGDTALSYGAKYSADTEVLKELVVYDTVLPFQRKNRILHENNDGENSINIADANGADAQEDFLNDFLQETAVVVPEKPQPEKKPVAQEPARPAPVEKKPVEKPEEPAPAPVPQTNILPEPEIQKNVVPEPEISPVDNTLALQEAAKAAARNPADPYKRIYLFEGIESFDTYDEADSVREVSLIADPDRRGKNGRTLLHKAAAEDDYEMIRRLLDSHAGVNLADNDGWTALMYAARFAKKESTVAALLAAGADVKAKNKFNLKALDIASSYNTSPDIVSALIDKSDKKSVRKAFVNAVSLGRDNSIILKFLSRGMEPDMFYKGKTPLMYAAESNTNTDCIKLLLEKGADKKMLTSDYKDAYYFASQNPNLPHNDVYWSLNNNSNKEKDSK